MTDLPCDTEPPYCLFCDAAVPAGTLVCTFCHDAGCRCTVYRAGDFRVTAEDYDAVLRFGFPKSSGIPSTARAILNIVPERKTPHLTPAQKQQAEGVQRAAQNLNNRELRYGHVEFHP